MTTIARRPRFLDRIEAPDFRVVASQGCFVYAYLRTETGTPYYVGIASTWQRPIERHFCPVPRDRHRIRILRAGLTWRQACEWEVRYIAHWGRKDIGTGILRNRTNGGDGAPGYVHTLEHRAKMSSLMKGRTKTPEHLAKMGAAHKGKTITPETRAKLSAAHKGRAKTPEHRAKIGAGNKGKVRTAEQRARNGAARKGKAHTPETRAKISAALKGRTVSAETRARLSVALRARLAASAAGP